MDASAVVRQQVPAASGLACRHRRSRLPVRDQRVLCLVWRIREEARPGGGMVWRIREEAAERLVQSWRRGIHGVLDVSIGGGGVLNVFFYSVMIGFAR